MKVIREWYKYVFLLACFSIYISLDCNQVKLCFNREELVEASEAECLVDQQAESIVQETEGKQKTDSHQQENEETGAAGNEEIFAQEAEEMEEKEDKESISHGSEGTEHAGEGVSFTQVSEQEKVKHCTK